MSLLPPPVPPAAQQRPRHNSAPGYSSVIDDVKPLQISSSSSAMVVTSSGLEALRSVLEAANTLPCIKYITQVSITLLKIIEEIQATNEAVRKIILRAKDITLAVAGACSDAPDEISGRLESDLQQLVQTMDDVLEFTQEISSRSAYKKFVRKVDDATTVKSLDMRLTHAFQLFEIQSSVSLRITQQQMVRQLSGISESSPPQVQHQTRPRLITSTPLHVTEGLYLIRNAANERPIETEHRRPVPTFCHAYMGVSTSSELSSYQIWVISSRHGKRADYTIRNLATGASLDVYRGETRDGTQVICFPSHEGHSQTWSIYGSRAGNSLDYCTIRSHGTQTLLDGNCPAGLNCDYVHMINLGDGQDPTASQQWSLTRIPFSASPSVSSAALQAAYSAAGIPRRRFVLQNVGSGSSAAVQASNGNSPYVVLQHDFKAAATWHFEHTVHNDGQYDDLFAIVTNTPPDDLSTLDFFGGRHIAANAGVYAPKNIYHMWKATPAPEHGAFCFRNSATGRLLSQSSRNPLMDAAQESANSTDASCQWRIYDASTGDCCPILYDSSLAIPPAQYAGPMQFSTAQPEDIPDVLMLRTGMATATMCSLFADSLQRENNIIREMFSIGCSSLVLAPRLITGWKSCLGLYDLVIRDERPALGPASIFPGKDDSYVCFPEG